MENQMTSTNKDGSAPGLSVVAGSALPSIGTHFAQALADGRYDENKAWKYGRSEKRRPTDPVPPGMKFGGQIPMDDSPNTEVRNVGDGAAS